MSKAWTEEELTKLYGAVEKTGGDFDELSKQFPDRSSRACYLRWHKEGGRAPQQKYNTPEKVATKHELQDLKKLSELQKDLLETQATQRWHIAPAKRPKKTQKEFLRIIVPDSHGCFIDQAAASAFLADLERLDPREIIMLGDHVDCGGFLAQHHTLGYVAERDYSFADDVTAANEFLDAIQKAAPNAEIHYLEGNHEHRIQRWVATQVIRNKDAKLLYETLNIGVLLHLKQRKIHWYQQGVKYDGIPIPGTIRLGRCYFTHGSRTNKHAASAMLSDFGGNVVYGHTHRMDSFAQRTVREDGMGAWCPGCLCQLQPLYMNTNCSQWAHGYGMQIVNEKDGLFLHFNVPLLDGHSLMQEMLLAAGRPDRARG